MRAGEDTGSQEVSTPHHGLFATTHWSVVLAAHGSDTPAARTALETLFRQYQRPLLVYLRQRGQSPHDAEDSLQAFFHRLLATDALEAASRQRGRFRSFLLAALKNFLTNEHDRTLAAKRGGGHEPLPFDDATDQIPSLKHDEMRDSFDHHFDSEWAQTIFEQALKRLEEEFSLEGKQPQFVALAPFLSRLPAPGEYEHIAAQIGIRAGLMATVVSRLRRRFRDLVRAEITTTVATPAEVEGELAYFVELLSR